MNRIGPDWIGRGFKPNWIEPVFLGEFEGAEPPHTLRGVRGGRQPPPPFGARDSERASVLAIASKLRRPKADLKGGPSPPRRCGGVWGAAAPPAETGAD